MKQLLASPVLLASVTILSACGLTTRNEVEADDGDPSTDGAPGEPGVPGDDGAPNPEVPIDEPVTPTREPNPEARFRGHWTVGWDHSGFMDCENPSTPYGWWLAGLSPDADPILSNLTPTSDWGEWQRVYIEIDGELSDEGLWGNLGHYARRLEVTRLYYAGQPSSDDCDASARQ